MVLGPRGLGVTPLNPYMDRKLSTGTIDLAGQLWPVSLRLRE